mgnify:CR=1 FL=1
MGFSEPLILKKMTVRSMIRKASIADCSFRISYDILLYIGGAHD